MEVRYINTNLGGTAETHSVLIFGQNEFFRLGGIRMDKTIAFLGAGKAAEAIISGIIKSEIVGKNQIYVTNRSDDERLQYIEETYGVNCTKNKESILRKADIIFLAMKPYDLEGSLSEVKTYFSESQLIISILAGVSSEKISSTIGISIPVIRVMPNTSALIGYSATALSKGEYATEEHVDIAKTLFQTIGTTTVVEEEMMHIITAISGSGPAFVYYLVEAMEKSAVEAGLDKGIAKELLTQTVIGAGNMLKLSGNEAEVLRKNITSPKGTTEAGINILEENHFQKIVMECVKGAKERSEELGRD